MNWIAWSLVSYIGISALLTVAAVGRKREPLTAGVAVLSVVFAGLIIWGIVALATGGAS